MEKDTALKAMVRISLTLCAAILVSFAVTGCKGAVAPLSEADKQNWKGSAPPAGFETEMAKQNREWQEREARTAAKLGKKPETPPPGTIVK